jgi:hypothetical protein
MAEDTIDLQEQLALQRQKVDVDHFDITVRELIRMAAENELQTAPVYQRKFRWDETKESRLIESLLLNFPIPSIFVAANQDGSWEVVDGLQRISTLIHFAGNAPELWERVGKHGPLTLAGLRDLTAFTGLTLDDLPPAIQLAFFKRALRVTALSDKSSRDTRFDLFERLNSGGVALSPQEVRAAVYQGRFNDLLRELADLPEFRATVRLQQGREDDGTREELVLKFFAYYHAQEGFSGAVTAFLNDFMETKSAQLDIDVERERFVRMATALHDILGGAQFVKQNYGPTPLVELEAVMVATARVLDEYGAVRTPDPGWIEDAELVRTSKGGTNTRAMLAGRIDRARVLLTPV